MTTENINDISKEFNWGAFFLTFIWGTKYKAWITLLAIPLIFIHLPLYFNLFLLFCFQIYCGINGNKWAFQNYKKTKNEFHKEQIKWAILGIIINIFIPFIFLTVFAEFLIKNPENPKEFMENSQCTITYNKLKQGLPNIIINEKSTSEDIARQFFYQFYNSRLAGNTVIFSLSERHKHKEAYSITFYKNPNEDCHLYQGNCYIDASYIISSDIPDMKTCKFWINKEKKIIPDEETRKALIKGVNIFNYL